MTDGNGIETSGLCISGIMAQDCGDTGTHGAGAIGGQP